MDTAVDDFLKEINELLPPKPKIVWKECFDESSGFSYYWNTETDEVTWEAPAEYKKQSKSSSRLYIPPPSEPKFKLCSLPKVDEVNVKIYKINEACPDSVKTVKSDGQKSVKKREKEESKVSNVKVSLIAYGSSSESDNEDDDKNKKSKVEDKLLSKDNEIDSEPSDFDDEVDILTQIQKKANDLKKIDGDDATEINKSIETKNSNAISPKKGVSLVPGYGDDDSDEEIDVSTSNLKSKSLFPAAKHIEGANSPSIDDDLAERNPFIDKNPNEKNQIDKNLNETTFFTDLTSNSNSSHSNSNSNQDNFEIDAKAFQRKRRIGISLVNTVKRKNDGEEVKKVDEVKAGAKKIEYPGFKSGGILFGDSLNEKNDLKEKNNDKEDGDVVKEGNDDKKGDEEGLVNEIKDMRDTLEEKLKFLCEGHPQALPVQVMIIQMETLFTAMLEDSLKPVYLKNWLNSTVEDLTKLEKEAAPSGWLLQWDRSHKRYYYHNQTTGDSQWDFPEADAIRTEEAMDISMTPPHDDQSTNRNTSEIEMTSVEPPPAPSIRNKSISPPPPPVISKIDTIEQPLPPGVEDEITIPKDKESNGKDGSFSSELSSFYSDIAAIESNLPQTVLSKNDPDEVKLETNVAQPPKKKRKVKVSSGLAMKKKGVSQMVEKWKNLQKNYD